MLVLGLSEIHFVTSVWHKSILRAYPVWLQQKLQVEEGQSLCLSRNPEGFASFPTLLSAILYAGKICLQQMNTVAKENKKQNNHSSG